MDAAPTRSSPARERSAPGGGRRGPPRVAVAPGRPPCARAAQPSPGAARPGSGDISPLLRASTNPWGIANEEDKAFGLSGGLGPALGASNDDERDVSTISGQSSTASAWMGGARAPSGFESSVARAPPGFESVQREPRRMNSAEDPRQSASSGGTAGGFRRNTAALRVATGAPGSFNQVQQLTPQPGTVAVAVAVSISKTSESEDDKGEGKFTLFHVAVETSFRTWTVQRRYRQFCELHATVRPSAPVFPTAAAAAAARRPPPSTSTHPTPPHPAPLSSLRTVAFAASPSSGPTCPSSSCPSCRPRATS